MIKVLIIGIGGFLGSISRYGVSVFFEKTALASFPYGTIAVNLLGSLLIGVVFGLLQKGNILSEEWRLFLAVGFLGSFTTFSTFAYENFHMFKDGQLLSALLYISISVIVGIVLAYLGYLVSS